MQMGKNIKYRNLPDNLIIPHNVLENKFNNFILCCKAWTRNMNPTHLSFPQTKQKFSEFSEFRESDKPLKHEFGSI